MHCLEVIISRNAKASNLPIEESSQPIFSGKYVNVNRLLAEKESPDEKDCEVKADQAAVPVSN